MKELEVYKYNGKDVTFHKGDFIMINATQMAKTFNKAPRDWLRTKPAKEFIEALSDVRHICPSKLVSITKGGNPKNQGTWLHEDIALELARWLNPKFAIWCNDRIKEILKYGVSGTTEGILDIISNPENAIKILEALQEERGHKNEYIFKLKHARRKIELLEIINKDLQSKAQYAQNVLKSDSTYTFTEIAKELDITSAEALSKILEKDGIIFRQSNKWFLRSRYCGKGYSKTRTHKYSVDLNGRTKTNHYMVWTEKGRSFLHKHINNRNKINKR